MASTERKRIKRLAAKFDLPYDLAEKFYFENKECTKAAREHIRLLILFNLL